MEKKENYLKQAWLVVVLSIIFGASLSGVEMLLKDRINSNKQLETLSQIAKLVPESLSGEKVDINGMTVYKAMNGTEQKGWVILAKGMGFADSIEILLGVNKDASKITGLYVLDQKETPGLGNKIVENDFRMQFQGKTTDSPLKTVKSNDNSGNKISAVTGATISSVSVCGIVNKALNNFREQLDKQG